jgi:hypothetical protein
MSTGSSKKQARAKTDDDTLVVKEEELIFQINHLNY